MIEPHTVEFVRASDIFTLDELDTLSLSGRLTWGDAAHTLVQVSDVKREAISADLANTQLHALPDTLLIDLET